jgi:hypothetical protein
MGDDPRDLNLLMLAVHHGLLTAERFDEYLGDAGPETSRQIREAVSKRPPRDPGATAIRVEVVMACGPCAVECAMDLEQALRKPPCPGCRGVLRFVRQAGAATQSRPAPGPLPEDVRRFAEDPANRFGKYVLMGRLGSGGMGEVHKAWDTLLQRAVAIKFPRATGDEDVRRLYLEAQGAGALSHPNLAAIHEVAEAGGRHYIAMQFIDGKTADEAAGPEPDPRLIARWIRDAARGVADAHDKGVVHRDLKPSNLMIDRNGRVFVMDFGLAKVLGGTGGGTVSGVILGTPAYMPPEQAAGNAHQIDRRSDVYALGATLYTLLAGRKPFDGDSATDILVKILTTDPAPLRELRPSVPRELEGIVERAMARARDQRYAGAREFADDLERFLQGEAVSARSSTVGRRLQRGARRHKALLLSVAVAAALAAAAGLGALAFRDRGPDPARTLADWTALLSDLRSVLAPDRFDAPRARALLDRARREFPAQQAAVDALVEEEARGLVRRLETLSRSEWPASRDLAARSRDWLTFAARSTAPADRILAWKGTCTILVHVTPWAELSGPWAASLPPEERATPFALKDVEILDAPLELRRGAEIRRIPLPALKSGMSVRIEGSWDRPESITAKEAP